MNDARRWVCLDIGETLIDETRVWTTWAHLLGVTPLVLHAALGVEVAAGRSYPQALARFEPDWMLRLGEFGETFGGFQPTDLYPDAISGIEALQGAGFGVAVIGNQPASRSSELRAIGVDPDVMIMSQELGVEKPASGFYDAILRHLGHPLAVEVTYVGDRMDNDIWPARAHGLDAIHLRRGPWGILGPQDDGTATGVASDLADVLEILNG